jgi:hypothetical protein
MVTKRQKETKLEDIIPEETLKYIIATYEKIKEIEDIPVKDIEWLLEYFESIRGEMLKISYRGLIKKEDIEVLWVDFVERVLDKCGIPPYPSRINLLGKVAEPYRKEAFNKAFNARIRLRKSARLQKITITRGKDNELLLKPKSRGLHKRYSIKYLVWALANEVKKRTGKRKYRLVADFLKPYYDINAYRLAVEIKRIDPDEVFLLEDIVYNQP